MAPPIGLSLEQVTRATRKKALKGDAIATCKLKLCLTSTCLIFITSSSPYNSLSTSLTNYL
jgi:hypothetical protein